MALLDKDTSLFRPSPEVIRQLNQETSGPIDRLLTTLQRPQFIVGDLLTGNLEGAGKNLLQLAFDLPTGGFLVKELSLAKFFDPQSVFALPESLRPFEAHNADITSREDRPQGSDLAYAFGLSKKAKYQSTGERLFWDLALGIALDPLTYLGGAGVGRGIAQGALEGATRSASRKLLVQGLEQTAKGKVYLQGMAKKVASLHVRRIDEWVQKLTAQGGSARRIAQELRASPARQQLKLLAEGKELAGPLARSVFGEAAERAFFHALWKQNHDLARVAVRAGKSLVERPPGGLWSEIRREGILALEKEGLIPTKGALYFRIPLSEVEAKIPGTDNFWSKVGKYATAPGWALTAFDKINVTKPIADASRIAATTLMDSIRGSILDKFEKFRHVIPEGFREETRAAAYEMVGKQRETHIKVVAWTQKHQLTARESKALGLALNQAQEEALKRIEAFMETPKLYLDSALEEVEHFRRTGDLEDPALVLSLAGRRLRDLMVLQAGESSDMAREALALALNPRINDPILRAKVAKVLKQALDVSGKIKREGAQSIGREVLSLRLKPLVEEQLIQMGTRDPQRIQALTGVTREIAEDFQKIPGDLVKAGIWQSDFGAFLPYLPHQASAVFRELLEESLVNKRLAEDFQRLGIRDVFTKARKYKTTAEFRKALVERSGMDLKALLRRLLDLADRHGVRIDTAEELVQDIDLLDLYRTRMFAHHRTMARSRVIAHAKKIGLHTKGQPKPLLRKYLEHVWRPLPERETFMGKVLGGGEFVIPLRGSATKSLEAWAIKHSTRPGKRLFDRVIAHSQEYGGQVLKIRWPGISLFYKPMLTSLRPAFHIRNTTSAVIMAGFDADAWRSPRGVLRSMAAMFASIQDGFLAQVLGKGKKGFSELQGPILADYVRALSGRGPEAMQAIERLRNAPGSIGRYTHAEVIETMLKGLGPRFRSGVSASADDLMLAVTRAEALGRDVFETPQSLIELFRATVKTASSVAEAIETRHRANLILALLEQGASPEEAIRRMQKAFVNYDLNSTVERTLRDVFPFIRFFIGSGFWIKSIAERPALVSWIADLRQEGDLGLIPESSRETVGLPLPWRDKEGNRQFLLSLGLPQEVVLQLISAVTPSGFRREVLGQLHPALKIFAEASLNRNFRFGGEFGTYRKAPNWLPQEFTREVDLGGGKKRYEVPGVVNEIIGALPISSLEAIVDKWFDAKRPLINKLLNTTTGVRISSVDEEQEFKLRVMAYLKERANAGLVGETLVYFDRLDPDSLPDDLRLLMDAYKKYKTAKSARRREAKRQAGIFNPAR